MGTQVLKNKRINKKQVLTLDNVDNDRGRSEAVGVDINKCAASLELCFTFLSWRGGREGRWTTSGPEVDNLSVTSTKYSVFFFFFVFFFLRPTCRKKRSTPLSLSHSLALTHTHTNSHTETHTHTHPSRLTRCCNQFMMQRRDGCTGTRHSAPVPRKRSARGGVERFRHSFIVWTCGT